MTQPPNEEDIFTRIVLGSPAPKRMAQAMVSTPPSASVSRRWGTIDSINTSNNTVGVNIGGVIVPGVRRVATYTPTVGETVMIDVVGGDMVVSGTLPPSPTNDYNTRINAMNVSGQITMFGGAAAPGGWLLCDGAAVSRTTYAALYAVVGTSYGAGNGTTTFNLPNMQGRFAVGKDASDSDFNTMGETGGSKSHVHALSANGQALVYIAASTPAIALRRVAAATFTPTHAISTSPIGGTFTTPSTVATELAGATDSAPNVPPYQVVNYIIKT